MEEGPPSRSQAGEHNHFTCNICLVEALNPVLTSCGHLFCWPCLYRWLDNMSKPCPVCKDIVKEDINVIPVYGNGNSEKTLVTRDSRSHSGIPPRPRDHWTLYPSMSMRIAESLLHSENTERQRLAKIQEAYEASMEEARASACSQGAYGRWQCNICQLQAPVRPVLTSCGHLFCWPCLYRCLNDQPKPCPVCRNSVRQDVNVFPVYGNGESGGTDSAQSDSGGQSGIIPPRPQAKMYASFMVSPTHIDPAQYRHYQTYHQLLAAEEDSAYEDGLNRMAAALREFEDEEEVYQDTSNSLMAAEQIALAQQETICSNEESEGSTSGGQVEGSAGCK